MLFLLACAHHEAETDTPAEGQTDAPAVAVDTVLTGGTLVGAGRADLAFVGGRIAASGTGAGVDVTGRWIAPAFIDSHVHLAYLPEPETLADGGIAGAVDLAAPESFLTAAHAPLRIVAAGPMITAPGGYPVQSWGRNGYGLECADQAAAVAGVDHLVDLGAGVIKVPINGEPMLEPETIAAVAAAAHARGVKVASHAMSQDAVTLALSAGVDVLAHTPTSALQDVSGWRGHAVISTLSAFGGSSTAIANLRALRASGATVLYGTDFGNSHPAGIDPDELLLLQEAGLDGAAILAAGTSAPAAFWGFDDLGDLSVGKAASVLVLDADPLLDPSTLGRPVQVWIDGVRRQ